MSSTLWSLLTKGFIWVVAALFGVFLIYLAVRAGAVAWFKTKREFERRDLLEEYEKHLNQEEKVSGNSH